MTKCNLTDKGSLNDCKLLSTGEKIATAAEELLHLRMLKYHAGKGFALSLLPKNKMRFSEVVFQQKYLRA